MVTWGLRRTEVSGRGGIADPRMGMEVEGNVEVTLARADEGGGGFAGASPESRGGTADGASKTRVTTSGRLVARGCTSAGLVQASEPGPTGRLGDPIVVPVAFVGVDRQ